MTIFHDLYTRIVSIVTFCAKHFNIAPKGTPQHHHLIACRAFTNHHLGFEVTTLLTVSPSDFLKAHCNNSETSLNARI